MFDISDKAELTRKETVYVIIKFLKKKNLLLEFCDEYNKYHRKPTLPRLKDTIDSAVGQCVHYHSGILSEFFVSCASCFPWKSTRRGYCFWRDVSDNWKWYIRGKNVISFISR